MLWMVQLSPISWFLVINFLLMNLTFINLNIFFSGKSVSCMNILYWLKTKPFKW